MTAKTLSNAWGLGALALSAIFAITMTLPRPAKADYEYSSLRDRYYDNYSDSYNYSRNFPYSNRYGYDRGLNSSDFYRNRDYRNHDRGNYNRYGNFGSYFDDYGYRIVNGNYVDCEGNIDNDMTHHTTDPYDTDPAHHVGQNCRVYDHRDHRVDRNNYNNYYDDYGNTLW